MAYINNKILTVCWTQSTAMKSESSCGSLCQHPECWRANLQRVKDAVRLRNGIHSDETVERGKEMGVEGNCLGDELPY